MRVSRAPRGGVGSSTLTAAVAGVFIAVSLADAAVATKAVTGFVGVAGASVPISLSTGGYDPAPPPPPPPPPGCEPDSEDPDCQPPTPPPPAHHHRYVPFL